MKTTFDAACSSFRNLNINAIEFWWRWRWNGVLPAIGFLIETLETFGPLSRGDDPRPFSKEERQRLWWALKEQNVTKWLDALGCDPDRYRHLSDISRLLSDGLAERAAEAVCNAIFIASLGTPTRTVVIEAAWRIVDCDPNRRVLGLDDEAVHAVAAALLAIEDDGPVVDLHRSFRRVVKLVLAAEPSS